MERSPRFIVVLLACVGCGHAAPPAKTTEPQAFSAADTLAIARSYAEADRLDDAIAQYEKARQMGATGRDESAELASVYDVKGDYANAERIYREWLAKTPDDAEFIQQLGLTLLLQKRDAEGVAELKRAITLAPSDLRLQQDYGYALLQAGDPKSAAAVLEAVVGKDEGRAEAWFFLAEARAATGDLPRAIEACTSSLRADGTSPDALKLRARLRMQMDEYERAFADYELLARGKPDDAGAYLGSSGALIALNRLVEAQPRVERAAALAKNHPWVRFRKAQLAWRAGDREGYEQLKAIASEHTDSIEVWRDVKEAARKFDEKSVAKEAAAQLARLQRGG